MNVVPVSGFNTLPVIYDRGLIGVMHDWYALTHVSNVFLFQPYTLFTAYQVKSHPPQCFNDLAKDLLSFVPSMFQIN